MSLVGRPAKNHPQQRTSDRVDDRRTPEAFFARLHERHRFTVDAAASDANAMLPRYWTKRDNGLERPWAGERVWCNPPYSNLRPWVARAWDQLDAAELIVMLIPGNRCEQRFWQELVEPYRDQAGSALSTRMLAGRLRFTAPAGESLCDRPPFGCCLLVWEPGAATDPELRPTLGPGLFENPSR